MTAEDGGEIESNQQKNLPFSFTPIEAVPPEELSEYIEELKVHLRNSNEPNQLVQKNLSWISIAIIFCRDEDGIDLLRSLLAKGGDPNQPSPFSNFFQYTLSADSTEPLVLLISAGLNLNQVYAAQPGFLLSEERPFTILDYALDIQKELVKNKRVLSGAQKKFGVNMNSRQRFINETISLLKSHGAKCAAEII
jgi:hypothetical protein